MYFAYKVPSNYISFNVGYNYDYLNSLNETYKQTILNNNDKLYLFFPDLSFSPNNFQNSLDIQLDFLIIDLNPNIKYINQLKYAETKLEQDENFLFENFSQLDSKIHVANLREFNEPIKSQSEFLSDIRINLDGLYYNKITRIYKKLPDVLAQVLGIMEPLMLVFSFFIEYFTKYKLDNFLVNNFLCFFTNDKNKHDTIIWENENFNDFKNIFKYIRKNSNYNKKTSIRNNKNLIGDFNNNIEKKNDTDFHSKLSKRYSINDENNNCQKRNISYECKSSPYSKDFINEINFDLFNQININNNNSDNNLTDNSKHLKYLSNIKENTYKKKDLKKRLFDSFNLSLKKKNSFPIIQFIDYYFPFLINKKSRFYISRLNNMKIVKYFSNEILQKLDLLYYLKMVITMKLFKNNYLRKEVNKESSKFLLKSLYFMRDKDIESLVNEIEHE